MQSEIESINRLINKNSKVSCHYLINRKGTIMQMVKKIKLLGMQECQSGKI